MSPAQALPEQKILDFLKQKTVVETSGVGFIIGIEGIDAAGKRTQSSLLRSWLIRRGIRTEILSFPDYTTHLGMELKKFLAGERDYSPHLSIILFSEYSMIEHINIRTV